jgi:Flp pilus assembly protein TadB
MQSSGNGFLMRLVEGISLPIWIVLAVLPPLLAGAVIAVPKMTTKRRTTPRSSERTLDRLEQEFRGVLSDLVGDVERSGGVELSSALRAAGIEAPIAAHAARVRERMWQANYGPEADVDPDELTAEVKEILKALSGTVAGFALMLLCLVGTSADLSAQSPERLYEAGALRAAADSFEMRASAEPWVLSHWYNLGATWERAGDTERARRAWIRAARLSPRNDRVRAALNQLPPQDITSNRMTPVSPITPAEALLAAICCWITAWTIAAFRVRKLITVLVVFAALTLAAYGLYLTNAYAGPVALISSPEVPLRAAPYGPAQPRQFLTAGVAVRVSRVDGPWMLVERGADRGWLLSEEVIELR